MLKRIKLRRSQVKIQEEIDPDEKNNTFSQIRLYRDKGPVSTIQYAAAIMLQWISTPKRFRNEWKENHPTGVIYVYRKLRATTELSPPPPARPRQIAVKLT